MWRSSRHTLLGSLAALSGTQVFWVGPANQLPDDLKWKITLNLILALQIMKPGRPGVLSEVEMDMYFTRMLLSAHLSLGGQSAGRNARAQLCPLLLTADHPQLLHAHTCSHTLGTKWSELHHFSVSSLKSITSFCKDLYSGLHRRLWWLTATEFKTR